MTAATEKTVAELLAEKKAVRAAKSKIRKEELRKIKEAEVRYSIGISLSEPDAIKLDEIILALGLPRAASLLRMLIQMDNEAVTLLKPYAQRYIRAPKGYKSLEMKNIGRSLKRLKELSPEGYRDFLGGLLEKEAQAEAEGQQGQ